MSIASNFPAIKPTLLLDFANTEQLDPRITFTRASTATYYGTQTAKAEENLLLQSQAFDVSPWLTVAASVTANTSTAPDGTSTADKLTPDTTSAAHYIRQVVTGTAQTYAYSVFAKADGYSWLQLWDAFDSGFANFDVTNGVTGQVSAGVTSSITSVGSGWYRCTIVKSLIASSQQMRIGVYDSDANRNASFTGDGTSGIILWGAQLEQRSAVTAYTPTTTQPITNYIPVLETAASGVARFDHNPTTFESLGLLIEEQRTNLLTYSEQFDDAAWTKSRLTITANTVVAPDGTLTGDKLVEDTGTGSHTVRNATSVTITSGDTLTASVFAKAAEGAYVIVGIGDGGVNISRTTFNLSNGSVLTSTTAAANVSAPIPVITSVGNGWYRCAVTATVTGVTEAQLWIFKGSNASGAASYTGDGYSGIYIWGAQLEEGEFITSYIKTEASAVTRAADAASMTGASFSSWYNQAQGTLYAESRCPNGIASNLNRIASLNDGTASNRIDIDTGSGTTTVGRITTNGTSQGSFSAGSFTDFQLRKSALAIQVDNFTLAANTLTASDTSALVPVVNRLIIGQSPSTSSSYLNGTMAKLAYYPIRVTNAQLQALTS